MLRCPLCLRELKPTDQFRLVCLEHDVSDDGKATVHVIDCTDENLRRLRCQTAKCQADFWSGIFLSHVGCSVKHPWVATGTRAASPSPVKAPRAKVTAAWEDDDEEPEPESTPVQPAAAPIVGDVVQMGAPDPAYTTAALGGETVTHKMISALWRLPKNTPEMWFPLVMLRAMRPGNSTGSAVVQVSGSTGAGKTVLSLQAQHHFGYRVPGDGHIPRFDLESFVHMSDTDCLVNAYGYLAAADKLRVEKKPITTRAMLDGIRGALGDVKAVFFKVPEKAAGKAQQSGLASWLSVFSSGEKAERARRSWQTLMFFDVPGEMVERQAPILTSISQAAHRVAVVINAEDLLAEGSGETLHVACKELARLRKAPRARQACIVVTQMTRFAVTSLWRTGRRSRR